MHGMPSVIHNVVTNKTSPTLSLPHSSNEGLFDHSSAWDSQVGSIIICTRTNPPQNIH